MFLPNKADLKFFFKNYSERRERPLLLLQHVNLLTEPEETVCEEHSQNPKQFS